MDDNHIKQKMQQAVDILRQDITGIRTGRVTASLVEDIVVDAYGGASKLRVVELASITVPDAHNLVVTPWDKQVIGEIRKAIEAANIGLNPMVAGDFIRITVPPMTTEDREKYVKLLHQKLENGRVLLRQIRQDGMHDIKKGFEDKSVSEDEKSRLEKKLQETTDEYVKKIEEIGKVKETELRTV